MRSSFLVLTAAGIVLAAGRGFTCDCVSVFPREIEGYKAAKFVYVGQVLHSDEGPHVYPIKPVRVYKGRKKSYTLLSIGGSSACGYTLREGQYVLVYAGDDPQQISICGTYPIDVCSAKRDIAILDRHHRFPKLVIPKLDCGPPQREVEKKKRSEHGAGAAEQSVEADEGS